ncbi:MAG: hypothetical protein KGL39_59720, partial [Patescibacteria group bacterium]|nr:hypothetical protein [Patescibacteria group bacterium]
NLLDLDISGLGASVDREAIEFLGIEADLNLRIGLPLSGDLTIEPVRGSVRYTRAINRKTSRLGIRLQPTPRQTGQLTRYVESRRYEIMRDLMQSYVHAISPARVESLYF